MYANSVIQLPPITWHTACAIPGVSDWRGCYRDAIEIGYQLRPTSPKWSTAPATQHSTADHHHHHHVVVRIPIAFTWLQTGWCLAEITVERSDMSQKELYMPRQRDPVREGRRGRGRGGYESPAGRGHLTRACHFSRDKWTTREIKLITDDRRFAPKENLPPTFAHTKKNHNRPTVSHIPSHFEASPVHFHPTLINYSTYPATIRRLCREKRLPEPSLAPPWSLTTLSG